MTRVKQFRKGIGDLTASDLNWLYRMASAMEDLLSGEDTNVADLSSGLGPVHDKRLVMVTGYQQVSAGVYRYSWVEAVPDPDNEGRLEQMTGGETSYADGEFTSGDLSFGSPFTTPAYNLVEAGNDGQSVESGGVNVDGADYPSSWYMQPYRGQMLSESHIPGTSGFAENLSRCPGAVMTLWRANTGELTRHIDEVNVHDGLCA